MHMRSSLWPGPHRTLINLVMMFEREKFFSGPEIRGEKRNIKIYYLKKKSIIWVALNPDLLKKAIAIVMLTN